MSTKARDRPNEPLHRTCIKTSFDEQTSALGFRSYPTLFTSIRLLIVSSTTADPWDEAKAKLLFMSTLC
jgi:hypothetical protein